MKTLYVHIGTPKTGTTAIQKFCWGNREVLERHGYCYPDFTGLCPDFTPSSRNAHFLVEEIKDEEGKDQKDKEMEVFRKGMEQVVGLFSVYDNIVVSDERIWRATQKKRKTLWKELKEEAEKGGYRVKILVYLRRQDSYLASYWKEKVKANMGMEARLCWEDYVRNMPKHVGTDYYSRLKKIAGLLGKENILVRRFEPGRFLGGSIYADFLNAIGLSLTDDFVIEQEVRNPGLTENMCQIKSVLNGIEGMDEGKELFFHEVLKECSRQEGRGKFAMFSKEEAESLLARYAEGNRRIAREYLGEEGTELFDMEVADLPKWSRDNPDMQDDIVRFVGMCCMRMMDENRVLNDEVKKLKQGGLARPLRAAWHKVRGR